MPLTRETVRGITHRGGTILGTTNRGNPFAWPVRQADGTVERVDRSDDVLRAFEDRKIDALIAVGGDGSLRIAQELCEKGLPIVGVPKTIDNDIAGTDQTFGFDTAVQTASDAIDRLHTTAAAHGRVLIVEVMGRYAGWIAAYAGVAGEADLVLVPEHPVTLRDVIAWAKGLKDRGREYAILVVAEGALILRDDGVSLVRGEFTASGYEKLGGVSVQLSRELMAEGVDSRTTILGHTQRGGTPTAFDRILALRYGARAVELLAEGIDGVMVSLTDNRMRTVPLAEIAGQRRNFDRSRFDLGWMLADPPKAE